MIGETAARIVEIVVAFSQCVEEVAQGIDFDAAFLTKLITERVEDLGAIDHDGLVRAERGVDPGLEVEGGAGFVVSESVGWIIRSAHRIYLKAIQ